MIWVHLPPLQMHTVQYINLYQLLELQVSLARKRYSVREWWLEGAFMKCCIFILLNISFCHFHWKLQLHHHSLVLCRRPSVCGGWIALMLTVDWSLYFHREFKGLLWSPLPLPILFLCGGTGCIWTCYISPPPQPALLTAVYTALSLPLPPPPSLQLCNPTSALTWNVYYWSTCAKKHDLCRQTVRRT